MSSHHALRWPHGCVVAWLIRACADPGFWFFGGNLALCRYYSRMLALQIKALEEGVMQYDDA